MAAGAKFDDDAIRGLAQRAPEAVQAGLRAAAKTWHDILLPGHFYPGASGQYNYFRRKPRYAPKEKGPRGGERKFRPPTTARGKLAFEANKRRAELQRGGSKRRLIQPQPLVKSGRLSAMIEARATIQKRGGTDVAALVRVPWYVWANKHRTKMLAELVATTPADDSRLQEAAARAVAKALAKKKERP